MVRLSQKHMQILHANETCRHSMLQHCASAMQATVQHRNVYQKSVTQTTVQHRQRLCNVQQESTAIQNRQTHAACVCVAPSFVSQSFEMSWLWRTIACVAVLHTQAFAACVCICISVAHRRLRRRRSAFAACVCICISVAHRRLRRRVSR